MPRRKPLSAKQRKTQLQEKRAIKRGDLPPIPPSQRRGHISHAAPPDDKVKAARKLQSAFMKPSPSFLDLSKHIAATVVLQRPLPLENIYPPSDLLSPPDDLDCPHRPKWRYDMTKKEVEINEERQFDVWLKATQSKIEAWRGVDLASTEEHILSRKIKSPSYFELNLEVWRQLWRVTELSSILLVLLDSRCPPLHIPNSLHHFITRLRPARQIIFVLTKTGVVGVECAESWKVWLENRYPGAQVVFSESYRDKTCEERKGQGSRKHHEPHIQENLLTSLVSALKNAHNTLLSPPNHRNLDPAKLAKWRPRVRKSIDWDAILTIRELGDEQVYEVETTQEDAFGLSGDSDEELDCLPEEVKGPLTIGIIGQPNVGKSSLLNALFGRIRVKASRTPGKTKHFQTLFWTPEIRLVDCPGLVLPNYVPMEIQVLCSTLSISQIPSLPSCISTLASLMPLEEILNLKHPSVANPEPAVEDKRTWRVDRGGGNAAQPPSSQTEPKEIKWTAMDIMTAHALRKGWLTAKAGRPDVNRAGNAILRAIAENRVPWAFWPPDSKPSRTRMRGIWILDKDGADDAGSVTLSNSVKFESESEASTSDDDDRRLRADSQDSDSDDSSSDVEETDADDAKVSNMMSPFRVLAVDDLDEEDSTEEVV